MTSKFFGGVRGFAIAGNSMRTRIFLFLFFASTSGLWAQETRQVREVREERVEEAQVQEANPAQGDIDRGAGTPVLQTIMGGSLIVGSGLARRRTAISPSAASLVPIRLSVPSLVTAPAAAVAAAAVGMEKLKLSGIILLILALAQYSYVAM